MLAHVIVAKFEDHLPLHRQSMMFDRQGIELGRGTLCNWVIGCGSLLQPLVELLQKDIITANYVCSDEATVNVLDNAATKSYMWVHMSGERNNRAVVFDYQPSRASKCATNLPEKAFVFCCFNQSVKIEQVMFAAWMRILKRCPDSVLWLCGQGTAIEENLRKEAAKYSINTERLIFADGKLEYSQYLKRSSYADIALDTRIYNGGTITTNMLWAGVPVITLMGGHFASRMASSIISAVGLSECITHSLEEYENLAVQLATTPEKYQKLRQKLRQNIPTTPLFNTKEFVANLDDAYIRAWENLVVGNPPKNL